MLKADEIIKKINELKNASGADLSRDEDLSIGVMNLISLEEHFFFTAKRTGKEKYLKLLDEARQMRKVALEKLLPKTEGEVWCISKHLLAGAMRFFEVGNKLIQEGDQNEAQKMYDIAYKLYSTFFAIKLDLIDAEDLKDTKNDNDDKKENWSVEDIVNKLVNCCKE